MLTLLNKPTQSNNLLLVTIVEGLDISLLIVEPRKMTKIENEEETDNLTITIANETHIETDPEAEIIIIGTEIIIIEIEVVQEIEIIEMTEMTTALEVVIDPLTLHGDPLIVPLTLL